MTKKKTTNRLTVAFEVSAKMSIGEFASILTEQIASLPQETIQSIIFNSSKTDLYNSLWFLEGRKVFAPDSLPLFVRYAPKERQNELYEAIKDTIYRLEFAQMEADANSPF